MALLMVSLTFCIGMVGNVQVIKKDGKIVFNKDVYEPCERVEVKELLADQIKEREDAEIVRDEEVVEIESAKIRKAQQQLIPKKSISNEVSEFKITTNSGPQKIDINEDISSYEIEKDAVAIERFNNSSLEIKLNTAAALEESVELKVKGESGKVYSFILRLVPGGA